MKGLFSYSVNNFHSAPSLLLISELCILGFSWAIFRLCPRDQTMKAFMGLFTWSSVGLMGCLRPFIVMLLLLRLMLQMKKVVAVNFVVRGALKKKKEWTWRRLKLIWSDLCWKRSQCCFCYINSIREWNREEYKRSSTRSSSYSSSDSCHWFERQEVQDCLGNKIEEKNCSLLKRNRSERERQEEKKSICSSFSCRKQSWQRRKRGMNRRDHECKDGFNRNCLWDHCQDHIDNPCRGEKREGFPFLLILPPECILCQGWRVSRCSLFWERLGLSIRKE